MFGLIAVAELRKHVDCAIVHPHCRCGAVIDNTELCAGDASVLKRSQGSADGLSLFESKHFVSLVAADCLAVVPIVLMFFRSVNSYFLGRNPCCPDTTKPVLDKPERAHMTNRK